MRKIIFSIILGGLLIQLQAQTTADFTFNLACFGSATTLTSTSTSTGIILQENWDLNNDGLYEATGSTANYTFLFETGNTVTLQVISSIDTAVMIKPVNTNPIPTPGFDIDFPVQCLSSNFFTFTNTSAISSGSLTYFWDLGNGTVTNTAVDTTTLYLIGGTFTITLTATSDSGCVDSIKKTVDVITASQIDFTISDTAQCLVGNTFLFSEASMLCDPLLSFSWDLNGDGIYGDSANVSPLPHVFTTPGTFNVGLKITTSTGSDSMQKTVYIYPSPATYFSITSANGQCLTGNSFLFSNSSVLGGIGTLTSYWQFGDGDTSTLATPPAHSFLSTGTFNVQLTSTSDKGCVDSMIVDARIFPQATVDFVLDDTAHCLADPFVMTNASTIVAPYTLTYKWDFGDLSTATAKDTQYTYSAGGAYTVKLTATSDSGCANSYTRTARVYTNSVARFSANADTQCFKGNSFTYTPNPINCSPISIIRWDLNNDGDFSDASGSPLTHSFTAAVNYPIGMRVVTSTDSADVYYTMVVEPSPVPAFTVNDSTQMLGGNSFVFTNNTLPVSTYLWDFGDGNTSAAVSPTISYSATGTYLTTLYAVLGNCQDSISQNMYVFDPIFVGFIANPVCFGDSMSFKDTSISGSPIVSINWDFDNDMVFTDGTGANVKYKFSASGTYQVGVLVTSTTSSDTLYKTITVYSQPAPSFTAADACQGTATKFNNNSVSADPIVKYYWDFNNDGVVDDSSGSTSSNVFSAAGMNLVKLTVLTNKGCSNSIIKGVNVNFQPLADFTFNNVCFGDSTLFKNNSSIVVDTIINYLWNYGDGKDGIILHDHTHFYATSGSFTAQLVALSSKGCRDTITKIVTINSKPTVTLTFSGDTTFYDGSSVTLTAVGVFDSTIWSNGLTTPAITAKNSGVYSVRVVDNNGCKDTISTLVTVIKVAKFIATDVITPNGDAINDLWIIKDFGYYAPIDVSIYNRLGDVLFTSNNYQNDWDGKTNGENLPEGAYYYIVRTKQGDVYKGTINIIR